MAANELHKFLEYVATTDKGQALVQDLAIRFMMVMQQADGQMPDAESMAGFMQAVKQEAEQAGFAVSTDEVRAALDDAADPGQLYQLAPEFKTVLKDALDIMDKGGNGPGMTSPHAPPRAPAPGMAPR